MTSDDFEKMDLLVKMANIKFDGHLAVLKFTTNWRVGFITPSGRDGIDAMHEGKTFDEAATKALKNL